MNSLKGKLTSIAKQKIAANIPCDSSSVSETSGMCAAERGVDFGILDGAIVAELDIDLENIFSFITWKR
jgi:hypothetical protein